MTERSEYVDGLRQLADILEANPELVLPAGDSSLDPLTAWVSNKDGLAAYVRVLPRPLEKEVGEWSMSVRTTLSGLHLRVASARDTTCERKVVGTREVTKTIPDPNHAVPTVQVTAVEEIVEWMCPPLLAEEGAA